MAEVIAVGASVIAIIQITDRIIGLCKFYTESMHDVPTDLRIISNEVTALKGTLEIIEAGPPRENADSLDGVISSCNRALVELQKLFPTEHIEAIAGSERSKRRKLNAVKETLAWPFKAGKAQKLLDEIMQYKISMNLALTSFSK